MFLDSLVVFEAENKSGIVLSLRTLSVTQRCANLLLLRSIVLGAAEISGDPPKDVSVRRT